MNKRHDPPTRGEYRAASHKMPTCRRTQVVDGVTFCFFVNEAGKMEAMPMDQYLANAGFKVRAK